MTDLLPWGDDDADDERLLLGAASGSSPSPAPASDPIPPKKRRRSAKCRKIDHTYRDFGSLPVAAVSRQLKPSSAASVVSAGSSRAGGYADDPSADAAPGGGLPSAAGGKGGRGKNRPVSFPRKLYEILTNPEYQDIICFMPHGRSWMVLDKERLASEVLPKHFNHGRFESFNRQVNGWGFKRLLKRGPDHKSYYHECFLRGRPELAALMSRLVNPGKRLPDRDAEPDFYDLSARSPLPPLAGLSSSGRRRPSSSGPSSSSEGAASGGRHPKVPTHMEGRGVAMQSPKNVGPAPLPLGSLGPYTLGPDPLAALLGQNVGQPPFDFDAGMMCAGDVHLMGGLAPRPAADRAVPQQALLPFQVVPIGATRSAGAPWPPTLGGGDPSPPQPSFGFPPPVAAALDGAAAAPLAPPPGAMGHPVTTALLPHRAHSSPSVGDGGNVLSLPAADPPSARAAAPPFATSSPRWSEHAVPQDAFRGTAQPSARQVSDDWEPTTDDALSSAYQIEPDPLSDDRKIVRRTDGGGESDLVSLSNIRDPDPLLGTFAEIYFAHRNGAVCADEFT